MNKERMSDNPFEPLKMSKEEIKMNKFKMEINEKNSFESINELVRESSEINHLFRSEAWMNTGAITPNAQTSEASTPVDEVKARVVEARAQVAEARARNAEASLTQMKDRALKAENLAQYYAELLATERDKVANANTIIRAANKRIEDIKRMVGKAPTGDHMGLFKALGLHPDVFNGLTEDEIQKRIKANFRLAALNVHPDHGGNNLKMVKVNEAEEILSDPVRRREYITRTGKFAPRNS